jgi:hypothetical protein
MKKNDPPGILYPRIFMDWNKSKDYPRIKRIIEISLDNLFYLAIYIPHLTNGLRVL